MTVEQFNKQPQHVQDLILVLVDNHVMRFFREAEVIRLYADDFLALPASLHYRQVEVLSKNLKWGMSLTYHCGNRYGLFVRFNHLYF